MAQARRRLGLFHFLHIQCILNPVHSPLSSALESEHVPAGTSPRPLFSLPQSWHPASLTSLLAFLHPAARRPSSKCTEHMARLQHPGPHSLHRAPDAQLLSPGHCSEQVCNRRLPSTQDCLLSQAHAAPPGWEAVQTPGTLLNTLTPPGWGEVGRQELWGSTCLCPREAELSLKGLLKGSQWINQFSLLCRGCVETSVQKS